MGRDRERMANVKELSGPTTFSEIPKVARKVAIAHRTRPRIALSHVYTVYDRKTLQEVIQVELRNFNGLSYVVHSFLNGIEGIE